MSVVIGIFGESCTGKSTIAEKLKHGLDAAVYSGKDYLKFTKSEPEAKTLFSDMLAEHEQAAKTIIYVISEKEHLSILPPNAIRVLVTAELAVIQERFSQRMNGNLPAPVAVMLEKKHGMFDNENCDIHIKSTEASLDDVCNTILQCCSK